MHLSGIKDLQILDVTHTFVTDFGAENLRKLLPRAKIVFDTPLFR